jgi:DNA-binding transcriptional MerR regulator
MFTVGEFSKIAQVSKRLLRYYDEIELFIPAYIDPLTSRRYYSAEQMSVLNRILALKDIGLSLEQIQRLVRDNVSVDELQGMLLHKKAEIEQQLHEEMQRIRRIESRLYAIREADKPANIVIKNMPMQPVLSTRVIAESFDTGLDMMKFIKAQLPDNKQYGFCFCICQEENVSMYDMDLEIGCFIEAQNHASVSLSDRLELHYRELPHVDMMATSVVSGSLEKILAGYAQIGKWAEANGYRPIGMPIEVTLQLSQLADASDLITEVQFPIEVAR